MMNNNHTLYSNDYLEHVKANAMGPGTIREAENLLRMPENIEHRRCLTSEAHLATNMTGGRYNDHLETLVTRYLQMRNDEEKANYIEVLRATQADVARNKRL